MGQAGASTAQLVLKQSLTDRPGNLVLNPWCISATHRGNWDQPRNGPDGSQGAKWHGRHIQWASPSLWSNTIQPVYGICMRWNSRCNIVLSVQNELLMIVSMRQDIWFLSLLQVYLVTMPWLVHQLCPWPVTGICDFLPWMVQTFSPLSSPLTFFFFFFLSFSRGSFLWLSITWRAHKCAWFISDYIIYVNRF